MKTHSSLFVITVGILATSCSGLNISPKESDGPEVLKIAQGIEAKRYQLKNGLRLVVVEDSSSPTFAYQTWYDVGSRDEQPGKTGLAHLFEHMMFKGTRDFPEGEFDRRLEEAGAEGENAYTTHDHTTYVQQLPKERLELIVRLEADRMKNLIVNDASFATEREVVQNERRFRNENNPDGLIYQEIYGLAFQKHSYRWPVIGYEEDLAKMTATDAREFYQKHYSPNRAVVVVTGDVDADEVYRSVARHYGDLTPSQGVYISVAPEPEQVSSRRKTLRLDLQVEKLMLAYPIPSQNSEDMPALDILQMVLSGGRSSRLQKALVETGIASGAYAYAAGSKDPSIFLFGVTLQKGQKALSAERVILRELERLAREGVPSQELERAMNLVEFDYFGGLESNSELARFVGHYESQTGRLENGPLYFEKLKKVTAEQIRQMALKYLKESKRSVVVALKKAQK